MQWYLKCPDSTLSQLSPVSPTSTFILGNKSSDDISDLGKGLMISLFGGKPDDTLSSLRHVTFSNNVATAKAFVIPERLPPRRLQQAFIANECTFKSLYGWGWPMKWNQLNGNGKRKVMSWFQSWQTRMLCLTNSWKSSIATVRGDANPLDAAADAMDSPALLLVNLAKLKTVTIQTTLKRLILKRRRRMTLKTERTWNLFYGERCSCMVIVDSWMTRI